VIKQIEQAKVITRQKTNKQWKHFK